MDYGTLIREELGFLQEQERHGGKAVVRDRIRFLRLLKSGESRSQRAADQAIGLGERQKGYGGLVSPGYSHSFGKLSCSQLSQLQQYQVSRRSDAQSYVAAEFSVSLTSGLCKLFQRPEVKLKTGRPVNIRRDEGRAGAFKKTSLS